MSRFASARGGWPPGLCPLCAPPGQSARLGAVIQIRLSCPSCRGRRHRVEDSRAPTGAIHPMTEPARAVFLSYASEDVACDRLTIADFQLASMATEWRVPEMPLGEFPPLFASLRD